MTTHARARRPHRRSHRVAAAALAAGLVLAGCSADDPAEGISTGSDEPTATADGSTEPAFPETEVYAEAPERPADERTDEGAIAFSEYVMRTVWYAAHNGDSAHLLDTLDQDGTCGGCQAIAESIDEVADTEAQQLSQEIGEITGTVEQRGRDWVTLVAFERPEITVYDTDGEVVRTGEPRDVVAQVGFAWRDGGWELFNFQYTE